MRGNEGRLGPESPTFLSLVAWMDATHDGWREALFYGDSREIGSAYWSLALVTMHFRYTTCWFHVY